MKLNLLQHISLTSLIYATILLSSPAASALTTDTYATTSRLASGNWVKISVDHSGIYMLTPSRLRQLGFSDPSKVRVYGYGATRLPDKLDSSYIDDLPMTQAIVNDRGIIFYAIGPESWSYTSGTFRPTNNPFTTTGYYYLSDVDSTVPEIPTSATGSSAENPSVFTDRISYEKDLTSLGSTGHFLVGEDFRYTSSRTFGFTLPEGTVIGSSASLICSFVAKTQTAASKISLSVNGIQLPETSSDRMAAVDDSESEYTHFREALTTKQFTVEGLTTDVTVAFSSSGTVTHANLNYLALNFNRELRLYDSSIQFTLNGRSGALGGASQSTIIWDITDPLSIQQVNATLNNGILGWDYSTTEQREYVAFDSTASFPAPTVIGQVTNQNLHGEEVPDMVIFSIPEWISKARQLAQIHETEDGMNVLVVDINSVYNEFSSGSPDANSFRKMLKMFYDRSTQDRKLKYALFFGRGTYDNRRLTPDIANIGYPTMPIWQTDAGNSDNRSYSTDDIYAFLLDNSGVNMASDTYCIAVGRMPVTSLTDATTAIDKLVEYKNMARSNWRNRMLLIADDGDNAIHMDQAERFQSYMLKSDGGSDIDLRKLYIDAYERSDGTYPAARERMFRSLDEGVAWLIFIGHANTTSWTHENLLTFSDINNLYLKYYPILYAATCNFLRCDSKNISAAEVMWKFKGGGAIAVISANRPVYITNNGYLSNVMGSQIAKRGTDGKRQTLGEIYMSAKNSLRSDDNKLRYFLVGDPAMRPAIPSDRVVVERINGIDPAGTEQPILMACQDAAIEGYIADAAGQPITDFDGTISSTIYDAEYSVTTNGNGDSGKEYTFEQQGDRIFVGNDSVRNGRFNIHICMPADISNNFRPAAASLFAHATANADTRQATTVNRDFYVFGYDETAATDDEAPRINSIYMNHPSFKNGGVVNTSPMLIASISDNRSINVSTSGIGRQITILLDGRTSYNDVAEFYTPSVDMTAGGTIAYPLENLSEGAHTATLRIWDTFGNSASETVEFFAKEGEAPKLYDVYTDTNPASVEANFYLSHDRPDTNVEVKIQIFNLLGQPIWTSVTSGRSDMYLTTPVTWDLTDNAGRRVGRGIYIYRASVIADGQESSTISHKIAVTAP